MTNQSAVRLDDLTVEFPGTDTTPAVRELSFDLAPGRTLGSSGSPAAARASPCGR